MPRRKFDFYETPPHYIDALLKKIDPSGVVLEPCVGRGHISNALLGMKNVDRVISNDINPQHIATYYEDARDTVLYRRLKSRIDWGITNPPFKYELEIVTRMLKSCENVAVLARLSFLEPTLTRDTFWNRHGNVEVIVLPRYSFRKNDLGKRQTDSLTCCWLIWRGRDPSITISHLREVR